MTDDDIITGADMSPQADEPGPASKTAAELKAEHVCIDDARSVATVAALADWIARQEGRSSYAAEAVVMQTFWCDTCGGEVAEGLADARRLILDATPEPDIGEIEPVAVVDFISYERASKVGRDMELGGLGGSSTPRTWPQFLHDVWDPSMWPYLEGIRRAIVAGGIREGGSWHQEGGVPLFEDGKVWMSSMRGWGDIMAAIWNTEDGTAHDYCWWAWSSPRDET